MRGRERRQTSHSMLNALSLTRGALTWIYAKLDISSNRDAVGTSIYAYARRLRQAGDTPFADVAWRVERGDIRVLDERFADNVHCELLRLLDVVCRILQVTVGQLRDGHGDDWRRLCDLVEPTATKNT